MSLAALAARQLLNIVINTIGTYASISFAHFAEHQQSCLLCGAAQLNLSAAHDMTEALSPEHARNQHDPH